MSVFGGSSVFGRQARPQVEYRLYAKVSDTPPTFESVQPLTDTDFIEESDCTYQSIWSPRIQPHFKAGLLLCQKGFNIERGWMNRNHNILNRAMFLILCESGITHFEDRNMEWVEYQDDMTPANYIYLTWNKDHHFTTAAGKSIQLKVVDAHPEETLPRLALKRPADTSDKNLLEMKTLLHQMKLTSNKV